MSIMVHRIRHHLSSVACFKIIVILLFALFTMASLFKGVGLALAQSPITAEVDRTSLAVDEQLVLTVTVTGDFLNIPTPDLSQLTDFRVVGSSTSTQVSIINGQLTSQGNFVYRLQPLREGNLVIPSLGVEIDGQIYQTGPINIDVVAGRTTPVSPPGEDLPSTEAPNTLHGENFFVEAEVDSPTPYLGQQIVYTFRLYQAADFLGQPDYQPPPFIDFWGQTVLSQPQYNTTAAGRNYLVTEIKTALFPANIGPVTIAPAKFIIPGGLFQPDIVLETESVTVNVQSLPEGAPAEFSGAVGQFQIKAHLSQAEGKVDEPLTLVVEIEGAGNIEVLTEPVLPELPNWRVFDSHPSTTIEVQGESVYGIRRFERLIVPSQSGEQTIPPISFSYYDPQVGEYRTVGSDPILITIHPGEADSLSSSTTVIGPDKRPITLIAGDIRHIKPVPPSLSSAGVSVLSSPLYWSCWVWPVLVAGGFWIWQRRRQRLLGDSVYARRQRARRTAQKILAGVQYSGEDSSAAAQRALLGYLSDKLNRPTVGLTTDRLLSLLEEFQLDPILVDRVQAVLTQIDIGRFAPGGDAAAQSLISDTRKLINDLEKAFE